MKKSVLKIPKEFQPFKDFDGARINAGRHYRVYKKIEKLRKLVAMGKCPHNDVMVTWRCRCGCGLVKVKIVKRMVR